MAEPITEAVLRKVARLARLGLSESELASITKDIEKIIAYFEQIQKLNTENIKPMTHAVAIQLELRSDTIEQFPNLIAKLPYQKHQHIYVPIVLE
ncbi:MAG: Asp-tRNA(Asn)/Glu-tRNA(Gln) amidotransferase subunit GatC [candidate division WOR-3 bacterium]